ncbi:MAG: 3-hydroxyacyl-CoA dehydrogenase NAD-binding domain-containing protein [Paracoccaceae bacterium]
MSDFSYDIGTDNIAIIKWDVPNKKFNVLTIEGINEIENILEKLLDNKELKGVIITSKKDDFSAGMDLNVLAHLQDQSKSKEEIFQFVMRAHKFLRTIELGGMDPKTKKGGIPFVWACNGFSAGIATEIGLACHYRIATNIKNTKIGLPEILVGLFPGAGGATRVSRMLGLMSSSPILMEGRMFSSQKAKAIGLIDEVSNSLDLINNAKNWILNAKKEDIIKPWDKKGFKMPGGAPYHPNGFMTFVGASAMLSSRTRNVYPAAKYLLSAIYEGALTNFDNALRIEARWFTKILTEKSTKNMIRTLFINKTSLEKGLKRPTIDITEPKLNKIGVVGAGMMGAGIAYVAALNGMKVTLIDKEIEVVNNGIKNIDQILSYALKRGKITEEKKKEVLESITPSFSYEDLKNVNLVIEAVFEDIEIKEKVLNQIQNNVNQQTIIASNTSTLPISELAKSVSKQENFIGIHFFSPVHKMNLVEIIKGKNTHENSIARAFDFVRKIKKTPIIVNDARGFYANRCIIPYINEGLLMIKEGILPQIIENAALQLGMPLGPLQLIDEVSIELAINIANQTKKALGTNNLMEEIAIVLSIMEKAKRLGRKSNAGFYNYNEKGKREGFWEGLKNNFEILNDQPEINLIKDRLALIQCLEATRALESEVLLDIREGDVGAILGWGCIPWAGGPFSWMDLKGAPWVYDKCKEFSIKYGERFSSGDLIKKLATENLTFYEHC